MDMKKVGVIVNLGVLIFFGGFGSIPLTRSTPIVKTELGYIVGKDKHVSVNGVTYSLKSFLGIPYAKPPIGDLRFKKPEPIDEIVTMFNATRYGAACPQQTSILDQKYDRQSENCLFLNIFVPSQQPGNNQGIAVMVYLHGGGFQSGSGELHVPDVLSAYGNVVVVTINYRIGIFGFFNLGVRDGMGNLGLWDQHLALKWINRHITAFGGDSGHVTVFGHSSGATAAFFQSIYPGNKGLFQGVISQSGMPIVKSNFVKDPAKQLNVVTKALGCERTVHQDLITCLQTVDTSTIMDKLLEISTCPIEEGVLDFLPCFDDDFFKILPPDLVRFDDIKGDEIEHFKSIDLLIGFNRYDGLAFSNLLSPDIENFNPSRDNFKTSCLEITLRLASLDTAPLVDDAIIAEYTEWSDFENIDTVRQKCIDLLTDTMFSVGSLVTAFKHSEIKSSPKNTFVYKFSSSPSNNILSTPSWIQAGNHGDDLGFVFGFTDAGKNSLLTNRTMSDPWEFDLSYKMMTYWTNFAKSGDPNKPVPIQPMWQKYDEYHQKYLNISERVSSLSMEFHPRANEVRFWTTIYPLLLDASISERSTCLPYTNNLQQYGALEKNCTLG